MNCLRSFFLKLNQSDRIRIANKAGTTIGYLQKQWNTKGNLSLELCARIEKESHGQVRIEDLRPDLTDLVHYLRNSR